MTKHRTKSEKNEWKKYAAFFAEFAEENQDNFNKMIRAYQLDKEILKQAIQRQAQYDKTPNKS